jgi:hypothetical protein
MVRLSSRDASLLMDVLEQQDLSDEKRNQLLDEADPIVRQIGEALINPNLVIQNPDIKEAVESIRRWADETEKSEERQRVSA